jgi:hypothetical protein
MKSGLLLVMNAVAQVHVHQILIRNTRVLRQLLEIVNGLGLDADGNLFLQHSAVGVFFGLAEVVFFPHGNNSSTPFKTASAKNSVVAGSIKRIV